MKSPKHAGKAAKKSRVMFATTNAWNQNGSGHMVWRKPKPFGTWTGDITCLVLPMPTLSAAKKRLKWERMTERKKADAIAEIIAIEIATAFLRGQMDTQVVTEKREDYVAARSIFNLISP